MTQIETIKILEMLNAFYAGGKNNPEQQAIAWHLILKDYDFNDAMEAVLSYAKNDHREYAQFPTVGRIIKEIEKAHKIRSGYITEVLWAVAYGKGYETLSSGAKSLIKADEFNEWKKVDAEEFVNRMGEYGKALSQKQILLEGAKE